MFPFISPLLHIYNFLNNFHPAKSCHNELTNDSALFRLSCAGVFTDLKLPLGNVPEKYFNGNINYYSKVTFYHVREHVLEVGVFYIINSQ